MASAFLWTSLLFLVSPVFSEIASYGDFSGGLNTHTPSVLLQDNESPSLQNVVLDEHNAITRRTGFSKLNSSALAGGISDVQGVYGLETSGGTRYCVAFSSTSAYYSSDGCGTFTQFISTLTRNNDVNCDAYNDNLYCVNNQYNFRFNGTGTDDVVVTGMPADSNYIRVFRNRCFVAGTDATPSRLFWSNLGDCNTWTTATDYVDIDSQDGDIITGIGPPFLNFLPVFKKYSSWLVQFDNANANNRKVISISKSIGARNHREIAVFNNRLYFSSVGPLGGQPGVYVTDGVNVDEASLKVRGSLDTASTFKSYTGRRTIDTKSDFDAGTFNPYAMSSSRDNGFMQSSFTAFTENYLIVTSSVNVSTNDVLGNLTLIRSTWSMVNGNLNLGNLTNWTVNGGPIYDSTFFTGDGCGFLEGPHTSNIRMDSGSSTQILNIDVLDSSENIIKTCSLTATFGVSGAVYNSDTCDISSSSGTTTGAGAGRLLGLNIPSAGTYSGFKIRFTDPHTGYKATSSIAAPANQVWVNVGFQTFGSTFMWNVTSCGTTNYVTSGNFLSRTYDTAISTTVFGQFNIKSSTASDAAATFQTQASNDGSNFTSLVTATPGQPINQAANYRYLRYKMNFTSSISTKTPEVDISSFSAVSTGTWRSPELLLSLTMANTWGLFQTYQTVTGNSAIAYDVRISTYSGGTPFAKAIAVTPGSQISWSTGAYVAVNSTFTITAGTETAKLDAIVFNWNEGTGSRSATLAVFKNRLHFCAQSATGTYNDVCHVMATNGAWTKFSGVNARFMNVVSNNFIFGGSPETSAGYVYKMYDTDADDGAAISAYWESKDNAFGRIQNIKAIDRLYLVHKADDTTLTTTLSADTGMRSVSSSVNLSTGAVFGIKNITPSTIINANTFRIKFSNNAASKPWEVQGYGLLWRDLGLMQP